MPEPLSPEDFELFRKHLESFTLQSACPICHQKSWSVVGIEAAMSFASPNLKTGPVLPVVAVVCTICAYVRHFAWLQIKPAPLPPIPAGTSPTPSGGTGSG
jgi:hypothetical protein